MKVYELSKKYNLSDQSMINLLKVLKINKEEPFDSFSSLSLEEVQLVEKHLDKGKEKFKKELKKKEKKEFNEKNKFNELLIIKKASEQIKNEKIESLSSNLTGNTLGKVKQIKIIKKKVIVKRRKKDFLGKGAINIKNKKQDNSKETNKITNFTNKNKNTKDVFVKQNSFNKETKLNSNKKVIQINKIPLKTANKNSNLKKKDDRKLKAGKRFIRSNNYSGKEFDREHFFKKSFIKKQKLKQAVVTPSLIEIMETISVSDLAKKMNIKANEIIRKLISLGVMATINQVIDSETATLVAEEYSCRTKIISLYDEVTIEEKKDKIEELKSRPPIITVMGHVDHGKTQLLDTIRESNVLSRESGGITQHIGAYQVKRNSKTLVFLDTPGHEAFTAMRARGAQITDAVILLVAADDGVMPQTIEAINHAKDAKVAIIVAINKIDLPNSNVERVKEQLSHLDLLSEKWGGKTMIIEISALKKKNIDKLLDAVLLETEMLELKANPNRSAIGIVIESRIDIGRGSVAIVLVQKGTLKVGDFFVSGIYSGKVRALFDDTGSSISEAGPSFPVEVLGLNGVPNAGDPFNVIESEKQSRFIAQKRQELQKINKTKNIKKITLDDLSKQIAEGKLKEFKIVLKGDVQGSIEALKESFEKLSNDEVRVKVIHSATGSINENDVMLAKASEAIIIGFHVNSNSKATLLAQKEKVEIRKHLIIYDSINSIKKAVEGLLTPDLQEEITGQADVRNLFRVPKIGLIAGCHITRGKILKSNKIRVKRAGVDIHEGKLISLKRFKEDVLEVNEGYECGIGINNYQDLKIGDQLEGFLIKEVAKTLD